MLVDVALQREILFLQAVLQPRDFLVGQGVGHRAGDRAADLLEHGHLIGAERPRVPPRERNGSHELPSDEQGDPGVGPDSVGQQPLVLGITPVGSQVPARVRRVRVSHEPGPGPFEGDRPPDDRLVLFARQIQGAGDRFERGLAGAAALPHDVHGMKAELRAVNRRDAKGVDGQERAEDPGDGRQHAVQRQVGVGRLGDGQQRPVLLFGRGNHAPIVPRTGSPAGGILRVS